ncbi:riboflavin biosynthesis protein RibF [Striga asiatica]|uniref:Riboflavin biosynthesis protein RibF n=1 Tax=Striga asiatica TaxID=4170 RepID=A0A5A7PEA5_STRAF|nr:riboflavin biosynthesis protein RibF [Striga asiatica]
MSSSSSSRNPSAPVHRETQGRACSRQQPVSPLKRRSSNRTTLALFTVPEVSSAPSAFVERYQPPHVLSGRRSSRAIRRRAAVVSRQVPLSLVAVGDPQRFVHD